MKSPNPLLKILLHTQSFIGRHSEGKMATKRPLMRIFHQKIPKYTLQNVVRTFVFKTSLHENDKEEVSLAPFRSALRESWRSPLPCWDRGSPRSQTLFGNALFVKLSFPTNVIEFGVRHEADADSCPLTLLHFVS